MWRPYILGYINIPICTSPFFFTFSQIYNLKMMENECLPMPATSSSLAPETKESQSQVGQKLNVVLQYLNPMYYARLAQSFILSVIGSYKSNPARYGSHITKGITEDGVAIPVDNPSSNYRVDTCFNTVSPDLGIIFPPISPKVEDSNVEPEPVPELDPVQPEVVETKEINQAAKTKQPNVKKPKRNKSKNKSNKR